MLKPLGQCHPHETMCIILITTANGYEVGSNSIETARARA